MKRIIFSLYGLMLLPFLAVSGESLRVVEVEPTHTNSPERFEPKWEYRNIEFSVGFYCGITHGFLSWPEFYCHEPYFWVGGISVQASNFREVFVATEGIRLDAASTPFEESTSMGRKFYSEIAKNNDPVFHLKVVGWDDRSDEYGSYDGSIKLVDFGKRAEYYMSAQRKAAHEDFEDEVRDWFFAAFSWGLGFFAVVFSCWGVWRWIVPFFTGFKGGCSDLSRRFRSGLFDRKIRQAAVDEAVRQVTRQKISAVEEGDMDLLLRRMQDALERDDIDAAKAISSIIKKNKRETDF